MTHLPFALSAYLLNALAITIDKFLLVKSVSNPLIYIFYISLVSLLALILIPFTHIPTPVVFALASTSTILWTAGAYFMYQALKVGQISRVIPVIGTLVPLVLLIQGVTTQTIDQSQALAVALLVAGLIILTLPSWKGKIKPQELYFEILSALLFAVSYLILREAYLKDSFMTVLAWSRVILIPLALTIILLPSTRKIIFNSEGPKIKLLSKTGLLFAVGQLFGGSSELLLTFSVSLANPALVNSLQGTQYIFLFVLSLIASKKYPQVFQEELSKAILLSKLTGTILIAIGLYIFALSNINVANTSSTGQNFKFGVTFSSNYAQSLGFNWREIYLQMLNDLKVKNLRLTTYWSEVEQNPGKFTFDSVDFMLDQAQKHQARVLLVVGMKQPRWPECHIPKWVTTLDKNQQETKALQYIDQVVQRYKTHPEISGWQVENEPLFKFGNSECNNLNGDFLQKEVELVRKLDPNHPIIISDSGEMGRWATPMRLSDILGITLYRTTYNPIFGYFHYPLPPNFYTIKSDLVRSIFTPKNQKTIIVELQTEPWSPQFIAQTHIDQQLETFSIKNFQDNIKFAKETGFDEIYLWGVEWWYWMAGQGHPEYLDFARTIF